MKYLTWMWQNARGARANIALRVILGVIQVVLGLTLVWLSKNFIDETIRVGTDDDVVSMVLVMVLVVLGNVVLRQVNYYLNVSAGIKKNNGIRLKCYNSLFRRNLYADKRFHSGDVTSRLFKDVDTVSDTMTSTIPQILVTSIQLVGAFFLMRWFDPRLAWALLLLSPVAMALAKLIGHRLKNMTLEIRKSESRVQMMIQESVEHQEVLRSLESEPLMIRYLRNQQDGLRGNVLKRARFTTMTRFLFGAAFGLGYLLAFVWGGLGLRSGAITFGVMTSFLQLVGMIQNPIFNLLNMAPQLFHATASIDRLRELDADSEDFVHGAVAENEVVGVRFENVSFGYGNDSKRILENFSHEFLAGSKTAVMGETGVGKTTLFRLLLGFAKPSSGSVLVYSNVNSAKNVCSDTRRNFVLVPQGNSLMSGSIRFNLKIAKPDATDEDLRRVLHIACADFVYELPEGLDTELGERSVGLSEGQAQRIAIARGLLREGAVMLLDEISSALDENTERELYKRIFAAFPQKTVILITHRQSVGEMCDSRLSLS